MVHKLLLAFLALAVSTYAAPIASRDATSDCSNAFENALTDVTFACSANNASNSQLAALGQQACVNGTSVVLATLSNCTVTSSGAKRASHKEKGSSKAKGNNKAKGDNKAKGASSTKGASKAKGQSQNLAVNASTPAGIQQAQACADAFNSSFTALSGPCGVQDNTSGLAALIGKRDDCATAQQAALQSVTAACPASNTDASDALSQLFDAGNAGLDAGNLDFSSSSLSNITGQAASFAPPSQSNCLSCLGLAKNLGFSINVAPTQPDLAAIATQQVAANTAAALGVIAPGCGTVADVQKSDPTSLAAGVSQGQGQSCADATSSAFNIADQACLPGDGLGKRQDNQVIDSTACAAAQATAVGIISAACPTASS